jgi:hypothetical protein
MPISKFIDPRPVIVYRLRQIRLPSGGRALVLELQVPNFDDTHSVPGVEDGRFVGKGFSI